MSVQVQLYFIERENVRRRWDSPFFDHLDLDDPAASIGGLQRGHLDHIDVGQLGDILASQVSGIARSQRWLFGATIVIAGNIPGQTQTVAVAMFGYLETGRDADAGWLLAASLAISLASVWVSNRLAESGHPAAARLSRARRNLE